MKYLRASQIWPSTLRFWKTNSSLFCLLFCIQRLLIWFSLLLFFTLFLVFPERCSCKKKTESLNLQAESRRIRKDVNDSRWNERKATLKLMPFNKYSWYRMSKLVPPFERKKKQMKKHQDVPQTQLKLFIFNWNADNLHLKILHQTRKIRVLKVKIQSAPKTRGFQKALFDFDLLFAVEKNYRRMATTQTKGID